MNIQDAIGETVSLVAQHPEATVEPIEAIFTQAGTSIVWTIWWIAGDLEYSHRFEIPFKGLMTDIVNLGPPLADLFQEGLKTSVGRLHIAKTLHEMGVSRGQSLEAV